MTPRYPLLQAQGALVDAKGALTTARGLLYSAATDDLDTLRKLNAAFDTITTAIVTIESAQGTLDTITEAS